MRSQWAGCFTPDGQGRPAGAKYLREFIEEVAHQPGFIPFIDEDFEQGLKAWKLTGSPALSDRERTSGTQILLLDAAGQEQARLEARDGEFKSGAPGLCCTRFAAAASFRIEAVHPFEAKADAALAASIFHFKEITIPQLKRYLKEQKILVRS